MPKRDLPDPVGKCKICTINLFDFKDKGVNPRPAVFPCGIKDCPFETEEDQARIEIDPKKIRKIGNV